MFKVTVLTLAAGALVGCASVPDVTYKYHPSIWSSVGTVTQTLGCTGDFRVVVLNTPSVATTYSSDIRTTRQIKVKDITGAFADSDMTMFLTDDGRLKGINESTTGQGETIVKSAMALATAVGAMGFQPIHGENAKACELINKWGANKPITLSYRANFSSTEQTVDFQPAPESKWLFDELLKMNAPLPTFQLHFEAPEDSAAGPSGPPAKETDNFVDLELQKIGIAKVVISADGSPIGAARVLIPKKETYKLPIPKAAIFGKQAFSLSLSEAGAVTSIGYGRNVGMAGALSAAGNLITPQTAAAQAADLKAEADLMAQQQRLVLCQTKPDLCK